MKRILYSILAIIVTAQLLHSQNCTQCDNTSNPPGNYASEMGIGTTANGEASFSGGYGSNADGIWSFAYGNQSTAQGTSTVALGQFLHAMTPQTMVIGTGASSTSKLTNTIYQVINDRFWF